MEQKTPKKTWWRWGFHRWILLLLIIGNFLAARAFPPVAPHVQLPAEHLTHEPLFTLPVIGDFYLTNTIVAMFLADLILLVIGFIFYLSVRRGSLVPKGFSGAIEALLDVIYNLTESTAGKWAKVFFPWFATITLLVLVANWMELFPGIDSIGILHPSEEGYEIQDLGFADTIIKPTTDTAETAIESEGQLYELVPYVRVVSTDLNFTLALALIAVVMVQVIGFRAQRWGYLTKFWNVKTIFSKPIFGVIDFAVGILELVSEFSKVLSFTFRLFGNIFAGSVLLFVIGALVPVFAQSGILMLEFFVGVIQAVVFGLLTMTFMSQATVGHGSHEEDHA